MNARPVVLFACIHNSGRSVAAKLLAEHYAGGSVDVRSAGSEPRDRVHPAVAAVLVERGLSAADEVPTLLSFALVEQVDVVITMGCGETCPVFPSKRYEDWPIDDPAGQGIDTVRAIVDEIDRRVQELLTSLA